ncbi:EpsG family protein [Mammaliicoccus sciuri]|uniref:EpsG family protein n=1 Tax=Mammaliicoccus sciuri TaxID=1296 RepID=UPI003F577E02
MIVINLFLIILLIVIYFSRFKLNDIILLFLYFYWSVYLLYLVITFPIEKATDYYSYLSSFNIIQKTSIYDLFSLSLFEPLFRIIAWILLNIFSNNAYLVIVVIINIIIIIAIYINFHNKILPSFAIAIYIYLPLFLPMSTNILRQMLVVSLILLILGGKNRFRIINFCLPFIHMSSLIITIYLLFAKRINLKLLYCITGASAILFLSSTNTFIFGHILSINYYSSDAIFKHYGNIGNRPDFFIITTFILALSVLLFKKKLINIYIFKYTLVTSAFYFCMGYQAFSERFAIYNWILLLIFIPNLLELIKKGVKFK